MTEGGRKHDARSLSGGSETLGDGGHFLSIAAHDLHELTRAVSGYCEMLQEELGAGLSAIAGDHLEGARSSAEQLQKLVTDLVAYSRLEPREGPIPFESRLAFDRAEKKVPATVDGRAVTLSIEELPVVVVRPMLLSTVFEELIDNAMKFRAERPLSIVVSAVRTGRWWRFSVADNGIGVDARFHDKIFEPLERLHSRDRYPGSGLGLAKVRRIVEMHGGRLWIESQTGAGATLLFTLPAIGDEGE